MAKIAKVRRGGPMGKNNKKTMMGILFIAFAFLMVFIFFSVLTLKSLNQKGALLAGTEGPIGVVEIKGVIMESKKIIKLLLMAEKDESVKAIILRINSPGGAVGPAQEIYEEIRRINEKKPIYASFAAIAASGGYYIGSAARKIFANPGTITGSIGVIMQLMNLEKLFEFLKIDPGVIKAGRYKDIGNSDRSMTSAEKKLMQKMIDEVHRQFISDILRTRKDRIKGNIRDHAQGQVFSGEEAKRLGLVDDLMGLYQAGRKIHKELKLTKEFGLKYFKKEKGFFMRNILEDIETRFDGLGKGGLFNQFPILMFLMR